VRHRLLIPISLLLALAACSGLAAPRILVPVYFYQGHTVGKANRPTGLHKSDDGGKTFEAITWPELITNSVAVDESGRHYYLSCGNGVMISEDAGRHWRLTGGWRMAEVQKVAIDRRDPAKAWAATAYGVFRRGRAGEPDWVPLAHHDTFRFTTDVVQDLADLDRLWVCADTGLYASDDAGGTWREVIGNLIVRRVVQDPRNHDRLLAATDGRGLLESTDGGKTFHELLWPPEYVFCVALDGDAIYAGSEELFAASVDGGKSWRLTVDLPEGFFVYGILVDPDRPGRILVSGNDGVLESTDRGETWKRLGFEGALVPDLALAPPAVGPPAPLSSVPGTFEIPGGGNVYDDFRPETDPAFDARLVELRETLDTRDPDKWPGWHKAALAIASGGGDAKLLSQLNAQLAEPKHSMFYSLPLIGFSLHSGGKLPDDVRDRIREIMTTVPVYRGDTENHWVMHYTALLLAAQTWPETTAAEWYAGRTSQELYDEARGWLLHWARLTATMGQGEFDSPNYMLMYVTPMLLLYDFAHEGKVKQMAGMMLDLLLADYFAESLDGAYCGGHSRIIGKEVEKTTTNRVSALHWLYAGGIERPEAIHPWLAFSALSTYRPPRELAGVANDRSKPYLHREGKRVRNVLRFGTELNPTFTKTTYMTPLYALGSLPGGILQPIQQHTWDVTWKGSATNSTLFTVHPSVHAKELAMFFPEEMRAITKTITAQKGVYGSPDKLISASPYEEILQDDNVLLAFYRVPEGARFPHVTLYWPDCLERTEKGSWHFGRDGDFFLALFCTRKGEWTKQEGWTRFRCSASAVGFVVVARPIGEDGNGPTFEEFRADILAGERPSLVGEEPGIGITWRRRTAVFGKIVLPPDTILVWRVPPVRTVYDGPFLTSPHPGVIRMTDGRTARTLDFRDMTIEVSR